MMLEDFLEVLDHGVAGLADTVADRARAIAGGRGRRRDPRRQSARRREELAIAEALAEQGIPFVFATGGGDDGVAERYRDRPRLPKPFTMDGVAKALDSL